MKTPTQTDFLSTVAPATPPPRSAAVLRLAKEWRRFHREPLLPLKTVVQITPEGRQALLDIPEHSQSQDRLAYAPEIKAWKKANPAGDERLRFLFQSTNPAQREILDALDKEEALKRAARARRCDEIAEKLKHR